MIRFSRHSFEAVPKLRLIRQVLLLSISFSAELIVTNQTTLRLIIKFKWDGSRKLLYRRSFWLKKRSHNYETIKGLGVNCKFLSNVTLMKADNSNELEGRSTGRAYFSTFIRKSVFKLTRRWTNTWSRYWGKAITEVQDRRPCKRLYYNKITFRENSILHCWPGGSQNPSISTLTD